MPVRKPKLHVSRVRRDTGGGAQTLNAFAPSVSMVRSGSGSSLNTMAKSAAAAPAAAPPTQDPNLAMASALRVLHGE